MFQTPMQWIMIVFTKAKWMRITSILFFSGLIMRVYTCLTNKMMFPKTPSPVSEMKTNLWMRSLQIISMIFPELGKALWEIQGGKLDLIQSCGCSAFFTEKNSVVCMHRVLCCRCLISFLSLLFLLPLTWRWCWCQWHKLRADALTALHKIILYIPVLKLFFQENI